MTTPSKASDGGSPTRWQSRPVLSAVVRGVAVLGPAAVALAFSILMSHLVAPSPGVGPTVTWWILISSLTIAVLVAVERLLHRLLPLASLLKLSLLFPDRAPARYMVARKAGRPKDLERQLARAREAGRDGGETLDPQAVLELVAALSVHDRPTRGHSERVRIFTDLIAAELKLPEHDQDRLRWAALLHDVGKLNVAPSILKKPSAPTAHEWTVLKRHPQHGSLLIAPIAPWLGAWALAVEHHHERYDGAGYPHGLRADEISLGGRIVAVADSYETMTAARPYKRPMSPRAAREELVKCSGLQFDPAIVRAFLNISLGRLWRTIGLSAWISQVPLLPQVTSGLSRVGSQAGPMAATSAASVAVAVGVSVGGPAQPSFAGLHLPTHSPSAPTTTAVPAVPAPLARTPEAPSRAAPRATAVQLAAPASHPAATAKSPPASIPHASGNHSGGASSQKAGSGNHNGADNHGGGKHDGGQKNGSNRGREHGGGNHQGGGGN